VISFHSKSKEETMAKKTKKTVKAKKAGTKRKRTTAKSAAKKKVAKTRPAKAKKSSAAKTSRVAVKASRPKRKSVAKLKPKATILQANSPHPGMMGDGTEEQNLNQQGNPGARITQDDVDEAFKKPD
jgi:hypothetical protein